MSFFLYIVFLVLLYLRPVEAFSQDLQVYRPMIVVGVIAVLAAVAQSVRSGKVAARSRDFLLLGSLVGCIALSKITNGWAGGVAVALSDFSTSIFLFLLTVLNVTSVRRLRIVLVLITLTILVLCIASTMAFHYGFMADELVLGQRVDDGLNSGPEETVDAPADDKSGRYLWRVKSLGFLNDPNDFGQVIVFVLPLLFLGYREGKFIWNLLFVGVPGAVFIYTIVLTHSRGAILGTAALLLFGVRKYLGTVRTTVLLGLFLAGLMLTNAAGGRGFSSEEESAGTRVLAWSDGLNMLRMRPLFGVGYGDFTEHHERTAHNSFVLCFSELGLIGCFAWLGMIVSAFRDVNQVADAGDETASPMARRCATLLRCSVTGFLTCAFFLSRTYSPTMFLLLGICVATWHCTQGEAPGGPPVVQERWVMRTASILVGGLALVYFMVITKHSSG